MSKDVTPETGSPRRYTREEIRVFAYVLQYWEDEPDVETIRYGLISNDHYDHEIIDQLLLQITPLLTEPPENMDESWQHGVLHGGLAEVGDRCWLAESYMLAGHRLIDIALENEEVQRLSYPAIYNCRHAMELYLKAVLEIQEQTHDLTWLFTEFEMMRKAKFNKPGSRIFAF